MVAGVAFVAGGSARSGGPQVLRVNLSDLAAKGAVALGYLMRCPRRNRLRRNGVVGFVTGLAHDQAQYGVTLWAARDLDSGPISLSLDHYETWRTDTAVQRFGPRRRPAGDRHDRRWCPGLAVALGQIAAADRVFCSIAIGLPHPGSAGDWGHSPAADGCVGRACARPRICVAQRAGRGMLAASVRWSEAARSAGPDWMMTCLTGAMITSCCWRVPPDRTEALRAAARVPVSAATGSDIPFSGPAEVMVRPRQREERAIKKEGWSHF